MLKNILSNWLFLFLSILSVFILYPYCVEVFGDEQYGVWLLISSVTGYFFLLQMGVPMANVRFISKYRGLGDQEKVNEVASTNLCFFTLIGIIVLILGVIIAYSFEHVFQIPGKYAKIARISMLIATVNISLSFSFEVFEGMLHALQEFVAFNLVKSVLLLARIIFTFVILKISDSLVVLPVLLLAVTIIQVVCFYTYIKIKYPEIKLRRKFVKLDTFKIVAGFSVYVLIINLAGKINYSTDAIVIGSMISTSMVVFFATASNIIIYSMQLISGISNVLMPMISKVEAMNEKIKLQHLYLQYSRNISFLTFPLCLMFLLCGTDFIAIWMGEKYRIISGNVLSILTISYILLLVQQGVAFPILMGTSHVKFPTFLLLSTSILNLVLSIWWSSKFGVYGVAWGTTIPNFMYGFGLVWYTCKILNLRIESYLFKGIIVPSSAGIFFVAPILFARIYMDFDSYFKISFILLISFIFYFTSTFFLYLDRNTRNFLIKKLNIC
jgi:O-antigen/teichoic acid export membrane protein